MKKASGSKAKPKATPREHSSTKPTTATENSSSTAYPNSDATWLLSDLRKKRIGSRLNQWTLVGTRCTKSPGVSKGDRLNTVQQALLSHHWLSNCRRFRGSPLAAQGHSAFSRRHDDMVASG